MNAARLYPYLTPRSYPAVEGITRPLGHDVFIHLVEDQDGVCKSVQQEELQKARLTVDQARSKALENLDALCMAQTIPAELFEGPAGHPFVVWHSHWLAAACLVRSDLHGWAAKNLKTPKICASVPHRETLLLFPEADRDFRDAMRDIIRDKEEGAPKPITWELFSLSSAGVTPFVER